MKAPLSPRPPFVKFMTLPLKPTTPSLTFTLAAEVLRVLLIRHSDNAFFCRIKNSMLRIIVPKDPHKAKDTFPVITG
jgi:hypothetical protein